MHVHFSDYQRMQQPGAQMNAPLFSSEQDMKNTNFIFPAIRVKAFYESTHQKTEENKRLSKKANLYAMIKIESFVMPTSFTSHMIHRDFFSSRDMIISPLEPFTLVKAHACKRTK